MPKKAKDPTVVSTLVQLEELSEEEIETRVKDKIAYGNKLIEMQKRNSAAWAKYQLDDPEIIRFLEITDAHVDEHKATRNDLLAKIAAKKQEIEKLEVARARAIPSGHTAPAFIAPSS